MATHAKTIEWHDLIEDPNDLPDRNCRCYVTIRNHYNSNFSFYMEFEAIYKSSESHWVIINNNSNGVAPENYTIVAWAYKPNMFIPASVYYS